MSAAASPISVVAKLLPGHTPARKREAGLALWMRMVLEECDSVGSDFAPEPVHDLRVALRRCRSVADAFIVLDPKPAWKQMKKAGRKLFRSLGELRDVQVMQGWLMELADNNDDVAVSLMRILADREVQLRAEAARALPEFDRKQWTRWGVSLPVRANKVKKGGMIFKNLALQRYLETHRLHQIAMRNRSKVAFHNLRIGLKRFRYIVENFLPSEYAAWKGDLKQLQDLLGEVHDLDVLWATLLQSNVFLTTEARTSWNARIVEQRTRRINQYREKMLGQTTLWKVWKSALPQPDQLEPSAFARLKLWASALDRDLAHSQRVGQSALLLLDGFSGKDTESEKKHARVILRTAALLHNVGRAKAESGHHKASYRLICRIQPFPGCDSQFLRMVAIVARYHRGALPGAGQAPLRSLSSCEKRQIARLAGMLRLASAFDNRDTPRLPLFEIKDRGTAMVIALEGYSSRSKKAERISAARHLLETVIGRPIIVKTLRSRALSSSRREAGRTTGKRTGSRAVTTLRKTS